MQSIFLTRGQVFINKDLRVGVPATILHVHNCTSHLVTTIHRNDRFSSFLLYSDIVQLLHVCGVGRSKYVTIKIVSRFQQIRIGREQVGI